MIFTYGIKQKLWLAFKILFVQTAMCLWGAMVHIIQHWYFILSMVVILLIVLFTTWYNIRKDIRRLRR